MPLRVSAFVAPDDWVVREMRALVAERDRRCVERRSAELRDFYLGRYAGGWRRGR
jgi:hypothetical protein